VHCIVSGGGISNNRWQHAPRAKNNFLYPTKAMAKVYRAIYLKGLQRLIAEKKLKIVGIDVEEIIKTVVQKEWVVYAKAPFGGPSQVLNYLANYSHKVAIANNRILKEKEGNTTFRYKDYSDGNKTKTMTLSNEEFIRRFEQHILPKSFGKIRSYGYLANRGRATKVEVLRASLQLQRLPEKIKTPWQIRLLVGTGKPFNRCEVCGENSLVDST
jgi:hypothetical protein